MIRLSSTLRRASDFTLQSSSAAFGIFGIILVWAAVAFSLHTARRTALNTAHNETANLARTFEEHIVRAIKAVDQSLLFVRENYARNPSHFDVAEWARSAAAVTDVSIQLSLTDRNGMSWANSMLPDAAPVDVSDREHIRVQLDSPDDKLFISKPVIGRLSHRWSLQFTRKIFDAAGQLAGVAVVSVDPSYLTRFYGSIDLGEKGAITLIGTDGVVRAAARANSIRQPDLPIGKFISALPMNSDLQVRKDRIGPLDVDGVRRVTSYREIHAYPLIISVGVSVDEALAEYYAVRRTDIIVAIVLTVLLAVATVVVLLHQRRHAVAREKLRESERLHTEKSMLLETALEHMNQGIMMVDGQSRVQVCNSRYMAMLGLPKELLTKGAPFGGILQYQQAHGEFEPDGVFNQGLLEQLGKGGTSNLPQNYERKRPSGEVLEVRSVPLQDGGVVRTYTDITVRKIIEEDLRTARDQAHSATKAKSEFLATMSHEIRSPLSGLVGALDLLRTTRLAPDQAHMIKLAHGSALTLLAILNDILDLSKIEAGALTLSVEPVDLRALITELTQSHALVARTKAVTLTADIAASVPAFIRSDRLRLGQIITNLLSNAVKFTNHGSITLTAATQLDRGSEFLRIDVRDTGIGMDQLTLAHLFEPFTQADGSSSRTAGGTGLGLCISRRLARMLDGTLEVVSEPGVGSCFTIMTSCIAEQNVAAPLQNGSPVPLDEALAGLRILVVDDNPTNQWLTRRQLELIGATVDVVSSGEAALDRLEMASYGAVITDCHMPGMDGVALSRAIRQSAASWNTIPIIGLTADVTPEQAARCRKFGMCDLLYKPARRERIAEALGRFVPPSQAVEDTAQDTIFDDTTFHELFDPGDPDGARWLRVFCTSTVSQLVSLRRVAAHDSLDRLALAAMAHQLLGAALSVGAMRLANALRMLERAANSQPCEKIAELTSLVDTQARLAINEIETLLSHTAPAMA